MILNLRRFIDKERPVWDELEALLARIAREPFGSFKLEELKRFHYLAERTSDDLVQIREFVTQTELQAYLESLVSRAFGEIQEKQANSMRFRPLHWFFKVFPQTFRRRARCFSLALAITVAGSLFGGGAVLFDPSAKAALMPFGHLMGDPSDRVEREEQNSEDVDLDGKGAFSAQLMTHNTRVSILILALGISWGVGSIVLLFYNGVILGAVIADYLIAGEGIFLTGWLLPHGSVEIPAILIAGQAGLLLASAMVGWGNRFSMRMRLRAIGSDLVTLIGGVAVMLVWAGLVESFFSQDHEPALPYALKITVGMVELVLLFAFLFFSGREREEVDD
jgi:uncharacterized membrane protein SpoIIM required for sporulation